MLGIFWFSVGFIVGILIGTILYSLAQLNRDKERNRLLKKIFSELSKKKRGKEKTKTKGGDDI